MTRRGLFAALCGLFCCQSKTRGIDLAARSDRTVWIYSSIRPAMLISERELEKTIARLAMKDVGWLRSRRSFDGLITPKN